MHVDDDDAIRAITRIALERVGGFERLNCSGGAQVVDNKQCFLHAHYRPADREGRPVAETGQVGRPQLFNRKRHTMSGSGAIPAAREG